MICYLVYNRINGKCYVGQTVKTLKERWYLHCKSAKGKSRLPIHNAIRKYGPEAFMIGWLSHARDREELNAIEKHFIVRYNSQVPNGYNRTEGGAGFNGQHTEASRRKMKQSHLGKKRTLTERSKQGVTMKAIWQGADFKARNKGRLGKKNSTEHRRHQSEAVKKHWEKRRKTG